ncbi:hypothetical protein [Loktanella sp. SALINAS62]|uniref:hypothetical protein n=1 Tax=Loktanella sp. SALINAS62 TaxID=2706124 RepID=UPI001B8C9461|nr:hypothetical protein [Loktanella sp. SALINAS62]MBS1304134.1 hypothetical protein [Loktanella sp. SALINAS62]
MKKTAAFAAALLVLATPVLSQSIGGEVGIEYNAPLDGDDFGGTVYKLGFEYNFAQPVSIGVTGVGFNPDFIDENGSNVTLHASYHLNDFTSVGLFYAVDSLDGDDLDMIGLEAGTEVYGGIVNGYVGRAKADDETGYAFGADSEYGLANGFSALLEFDAVAADFADVTNFAIGAEYEIQSGPNFYAKLGHYNIDTDEGSFDQTYVTVGVDVAFGPKRGTTFESRSLLEIIPGF